MTFNVFHKEFKYWMYCFGRHLKRNNIVYSTRTGRYYFYTYDERGYKVTFAHGYNTNR